MMLNKLKAFIRGKQSKRIRNHAAMSCDQSSILLTGTSFRFNTGMAERKYVKIGRNCLLNCNFIFESKSGMIKIGDNVHIGGAKLISRESIIIGSDVTMAWDITIYDHDSHSIYWEYRKNDNHTCFSDYKTYYNNVVNKDWSNVRSKPVVIEDKVWIGFDVTILKGVRIGEGAVIGAKSVVTRDVPPWTVAAGNPAIIIKTIKL
jgi:acetyltransferase-like isoleucine patch superfamily enzyme